jgi:hypothetical protein
MAMVDGDGDNGDSNGSSGGNGVVGRSYSIQYKGIFGMPDKGQTQYL